MVSEWETMMQLNDIELFLVSEWPWLVAILVLCLAFIFAEIWFGRR